MGWGPTNEAMFRNKIDPPGFHIKLWRNKFG